MTRNDFLARRRSGVGSSDMPVIAGLSEWKTELELYLEKIGELSNEKVSEPLYWGTVHEESVARVFSETFGLKVRRSSYLYSAEKHPFMLANLDRIIEGSDTLLECKTANAFKAGEWGKGIPLELTTDPDTGDMTYRVVDPDWRSKIGTEEASYDEIPEAYLVQVQHAMYVSEREDAYLAVLLGGSTFRVFYLKRDDVLIADLIELATAFWDRVTRRDAPTADYEHRSTSELLKRRYTGTTGFAIRVGEDVARLADREQFLKDEQKPIEAELETIKNEVKDRIGEHAAAILPDGSAYTRSFTKKGAGGFYTIRRTAKAPKIPVVGEEELAPAETL